MLLGGDAVTDLAKARAASASRDAPAATLGAGVDDRQPP